MKQEPGSECQKCGENVCEHGLCSNAGTFWDDGCSVSRGEDGYQCQDCAEAAEQQFFSDYYGGDSVFCESQTDKMARLRREKDGVL